MMIRGHKRRAGFTLLEVILASVIAVFILGGLYFLFDMTIRQTQEARDVVDSSKLSRAIFQRMSLDMACTLAPLPPKSGGNSEGSTSSSTITTGDTSGMTGTTGSTDPSAGSMTESVEGTTVVAADIPFQAGVIGTATQLTMFVSRVPNALADANIFSQIVSENAPGEGYYSDLVRITYWMANGGAGPGLCRQERLQVTADGIRNSTDPDTTDEASDIVAEQVTAINFRYFDASSGGWTDSWDGRNYGPDGVTPLGPPRAIEVALTLSIPSSRPNVPPVEKRVVQVITVRTAAGAATPTPLDISSTTDTTTGSGM